MGQLSRRERRIVVLDRRLNCRHLWTERLHQHAAAAFAAAGPPRYLRHQLKRPLRRTEIGQMERRIGIDHTNERHVREVETLGNHLRSQQNPRATFAKLGQRSLVTAVDAHAVRIHPQARVARKPRADFGL
jgi:hypothetical protein